MVDFKSTEMLNMIKTKDEKQEKEEKHSSQNEIQELTETLQRLQADFENYKKRVEKQNKDFKKYVEADFARKLLPILDSFEIAFKNTSNKDEFIKGTELIFSSFFQTLEDMGLRRIDINGKFDPYKHEVLLTQECDKDEGTIIEELQKGYAYNDIIIRHSKVKVAKTKKICEGKSDEKNK